MGNNRPIKTKIWIRFLEEHGCEELRTRASHTQYKCPNCIRPITLRTAHKEIPPLHLQTSLRTMGLTMKYLYDWIKKN